MRHVLPSTRQVVHCPGINIPITGSQPGLRCVAGCKDAVHALEKRSQSGAFFIDRCVPYLNFGCANSVLKFVAGLKLMRMAVSLI